MDNVKYWNPEDGWWLLMYGVLDRLFNMENESIGSLGITGMYMDDWIAGLSTQAIENNKLELKAVVRDIRPTSIQNLWLYRDIPLENLIQHELSHWFKAEDSKGKLISIMDYEHIDKTTEWDQANKTVMDREIRLILDYIELQKGLKTKPK